MTAPNAVIVWVLGLGGESLDPPGGAETFMQRAYQMFVGALAKLPTGLHPNRLMQSAAAIGSNVTVAPLFNEENVGDGTGRDVIVYLRAQPADTIIIVCADSCGANKLGYIASQLRSRRIAYMAAVQASFWCASSWMPAIPDNVAKFLCIYASWWKTFGLGTYRVPLAAPPSNNDKTSARYVYVNDVHPGDNDVIGVQNPILADIKNILGVAA